ncbi:hypothetical protein F4821DRAFT_260831 [Hypoxylon rubiginosum]|uniref:Uncharacterized protein n=1 Tax=Hypoxylon rubiginosum TaxID=110542 RepID=A0ACC0CYZ6_9PEZI|nr:hypothetical protein F4821DRAFT_260831 [Hypoxylon rubiginosum]
MDQLPTEVLRGIISHLKPGPRRNAGNRDGNHSTGLAQYSTVCREFQFLIEERTFASLKISNSQASLEQFKAVFADTRRRYLLRTLKYSILCEEDDWDDFLEHGVDYMVHISYQSAIKDLFSQLSTWTNLRNWSDNAPLFNLIIDTRPTEYSQAITFNGHQVVPSVVCVDKIICPIVDQPLNAGVTPIINRVHSSIISIFDRVQPNIKRLIWRVDHEHYNDLKLNMVDQLARTLSYGGFSKLEILEIHHPTALLSVQYIEDNLLGPDHLDLSSALNRTMKLPNLKELSIRGLFILTPDIFELREDGTFSNTLRTIHLDLSKATSDPTAEWYFAEHDNSGRQHPISATLDPFLVALARAAVKMPALQSLTCLWPGTAFLRYHGPGTYEPCRATDKSFVYSIPNLGRWVMHFEMTARTIGRIPMLSDWNLPSEMVEVLKEANHAILLVRGCLGTAYAFEEI